MEILYQCTQFATEPARAYASWQRGTNENTNGLLRQFIPKGTDFDTVSDDDLAKYVDLINISFNVGNICRPNLIGSQYA